MLKDELNYGHITPFSENALDSNHLFLIIILFFHN
jgi:hypothetical protein